jgi:hypothetical protein
MGFTNLSICVSLLRESSWNDRSHGTDTVAERDLRTSSDLAVEAGDQDAFPGKGGGGRSLQSRDQEHHRFHPLTFRDTTSSLR